MEKVYAEIISSRTEIIYTKGYTSTKVRKMSSADDAETRCEYSLEYGRILRSIWQSDRHLRHRLIRFLSRGIAPSRSSIPGTRSRYYDERRKILISGIQFFVSPSESFTRVIQGTFSDAFKRGPSRKYYSSEASF